MKSNKRLHLPFSGLALTLLLLPVAANSQSSSDEKSKSRPRMSGTVARPPVDTQNQESPGRYRSQGRYRGSERADQYYDSGNATWRPSFYHQNKYYQLQPQQGFTANPSFSNLVSRQDYGTEIPLMQPVYFYHEHIGQESAYQQHSYDGYEGYEQPVFQQQPGLQQQQPGFQQRQPGFQSPYQQQRQQSYQPPQQQVPQVVIVQQAPAPPVPEVKPAPAPAEQPAEPAEPPAPAAPGQVRMTVRPADAKVYLNDRYLGTGQEMTGQDPFELDANVYILEVEHPDFRAQRLVFSPASDDEIHIRVDLTEERPGRRASVDTDDTGIHIRK